MKLTQEKLLELKTGSRVYLEFDRFIKLHGDDRVHEYKHNEWRGCVIGNFEEYYKKHKK